MNHATPGNWQASNPQHAPGSELYVHDVSERGAIVARCYGDTPEEAKANAELCAAAKSLRALLHECASVIDSEYPESDDRSQTAAKAFALLATLPQ